MTDRGLPIVDGAPACPFVAFEDDRDARGQEPDHRHRCYAEPRPAPRASAHQAAYCLSSAFPVCPTFQDWARREAATARAAEVVEDDPEPATYEEPPGSQPMPPLERPPRRAPGTDTPAPLAPRRNPPRDWAAPPPWTGAPGESPEPPPFLAPVAPVAPVVPEQPAQGPVAGAASGAAYGAESRGLAGSAADRLAGSYGTSQDDDDEDAYPAPPVTHAPPIPAYVAPVPIPPTGPERPPASRQSAQGGQGGQPSTSAQPSSAAQPRSRTPQAQPKPQDAAELFGPAWERPRKYEAYPSLRTRVGLPAIGGPPRIVVAVLALVIAAGALFFIGPMLLGVGGNAPGPGSTPTVAPEDATPTPLPTTPPAPTPVVYVVAKGDTISKIARKYHVTVEQLLAANPKIKNPDKIKVGDEITIPIPEPDSGASPSG
jgi:hypothetical protein